jgi:RNA polymerase primary sigma factor
MRDDNLDIYMREVSRYPLIDKAREIELGRRIRENNDQAARDELVCANLRFVFHLAKKYPGDLDDLIAEGHVGLIKAAEKFDERMGCKFVTYARWWITHSLQKAVGAQRTIQLPARLLAQLRRIEAAELKLKQELGCEPTLDDLADETGIDVETVHRLTLETVIGGEAGEQLMAKILEPEDEEEIEDYIPPMAERSHFIIVQNVGHGRTLADIGEELKISPQRVQQIRDKALEAVREAAA